MTSSRFDELLRVERRLEPPAGTEERLWLAISQRVATQPASPPSARTPVRLLGKATPLKLCVGVVLIVAVVGGALLAGLGAREVAPLELEREPPTAVPASAPVVPATQDVPSIVAGPPPQPAIVAPAPEQPTHERPPRGARRRVPGKAVVAPLEPSTTREADDLAAEVLLIGEIRAALKRHDDLAALAGVAAHVRRFERTGQYTQERMVYQLEALCGLGRTEEARRVVAEMLERWPGSPHAARVRNSCAAL